MPYIYEKDYKTCTECGENLDHGESHECTECLTENEKTELHIAVARGNSKSRTTLAQAIEYLNSTMGVPAELL